MLQILVKEAAILTWLQHNDQTEVKISVRRIILFYRCLCTYHIKDGRYNMEGMIFNINCFNYLLCV